MPKILLINPNTAEATTEMMVAVAQAELPGFDVVGTTARAGVPMIVTPGELEASAEAVTDCWQRAGTRWAGVMVACFGDPGIDALRATAGVPVIGICEAAMLDAARHGRRFGVATTTPALAGAIAARARAIGAAAHYAGLQATSGDPHALVADPALLDRALAGAIERCIHLDRADAVIVGGGPLGQAAHGLAARFPVPLVAPIVSAAHWLRHRVPSAG